MVDRICRATLRLGPVAMFGAAMAVTALGRGSVTVYDGDQYFETWAAASTPYTTIDFTQYPPNTYITDQYASQGVLFISSDPDVILLDPPDFHMDGLGLNGVHVVEMQFLQPTYSFAFQHLGKLGVFLYDGTALVYSSPPLNGGSLEGQFSGLLSTTAFDRIKIVPWDTAEAVIYIDNLYFSSVPAPPALLAIVVGPLLIGRRRRG